MATMIFGERICNDAGYATDGEILAEGARIYCHRQNGLRVGHVVTVGPKWVTVRYSTKVARKWARARNQAVAMTTTKVLRRYIWRDQVGRLHESAPKWWTEQRDAVAWEIGRSMERLAGRPASA